MSVLVPWNLGGPGTGSEVTWLPRAGHKKWYKLPLDVQGILGCGPLEFSHHATMRKCRDRAWAIQPTASAEIPADYHRLPNIEWTSLQSQSSCSFRHYGAETSYPHCALTLFPTHRICEQNITFFVLSHWFWMVSYKGIDKWQRSLVLCYKIVMKAKHLFGLPTCREFQHFFI